MYDRVPQRHADDYLQEACRWLQEAAGGCRRSVGGLQEDCRKSGDPRTWGGVGFSLSYRLGDNENLTQSQIWAGDKKNLTNSENSESRGQGVKQPI